MDFGLDNRCTNATMGDMGQPTPDFIVILGMIGAVVVVFIGYVTSEVISSTPHMPTKFTPPNEKSDWDMVTLGRIVPESPPKTKTKVVYKEKIVYRDRPTKSRPKSTPKPKPSEGTLYNDCVAALVGLGEKKSKARMIAGQTFAKHNPKTLDEFITLVFKR